jgi:hypothetical protein
MDKTHFIYIKVDFLLTTAYHGSIPSPVVAAISKNCLVLVDFFKRFLLTFLYIYVQIGVVDQFLLIIQISEV